MSNETKLRDDNDNNDIIDKKIENFSNIELPNIIKREAPPPPPPPPPQHEKEGFVEDLDTSKPPDPKKTFEKAKKIMMAPVALMMNLNPEKLTDTSVMDFFINILAAKDITDPTATSTKLPTLQQTKGFFDHPIESLKKLFDIDNLKNKTTEAEEYSKKMSQAIEKGDLDAINREKQKERKRRRRVTENPELAADRKLLKKYMFKTILMILSFLAVVNWAYYILFYSSFSNKTECDKYADSIFDKPGVFSALFSPFSKTLNEYVFPILNKINIFYLAGQSLGIISSYIENISSKLSNKSTSKQFLYILIFAWTFFSLQYFIGNYRNHMTDIRNMKLNKFSIIFFLICVFLYISSYFTDFGFDKMLELSSGSLFVYAKYLLKNLAIIMAMTASALIAMFFFIFFYIIITGFSVFLYPSLGGPGERIKHLFNVIEENSPDCEMGTLSGLFCFFVKMIYKNIVFFTSFIWILFMYYKFNYSKNDKLQYDILRKNINFLLAIAFLGILFITFLTKYFTSSINWSLIGGAVIGVILFIFVMVKIIESISNAVERGGGKKKSGAPAGGGA
jgi:hypothetical protein